MQNTKNNDLDQTTLFLDSNLGKQLHYNEIYSECVFKGNTPYYSESYLVKTLEKIGIGRPSTFASIIQTLIDRNYVVVTDIDGNTLDVILYQLTNDNKLVSIKKKESYGCEKRKLKITNVGIMALEFLCSKFNDLFSYDYTSKMEI